MTNTCLEVPLYFLGHLVSVSRNVWNYNSDLMIFLDSDLKCDFSLHVHPYPYCVVHDYAMLKFSSKYESLTGLRIYPAQMGIASVVHLYVFPAKPYELMEDYFPGSVSVLGDYIGEYPVDSEEVRDSERPTKLRRPHQEVKVRSGVNIKEIFKDVLVGSGELVSFSSPWNRDKLFWVDRATLVLAIH